MSLNPKTPWIEMPDFDAISYVFTIKNFNSHYYQLLVQSSAEITIVLII